MWLYTVFLLIFGFTKCVSTAPNYDSEIIFGDDYINDEIPKFQQLTTSFDLGGLMSGNRMAGVPLGWSLGDGELDVEGVCMEPGFTCQNCSHAVTCVLLPGGWLKLPLQECPEGQTCNAHSRSCSTADVPECTVKAKQYQHSCEQVGIFPDAYDCRKFHLCSPAEGMMDDRPADHRMALCPRHYAYDPRIAQCSIKLQNGQCTEEPVPDCKSLGESAVLPSSPHHYYVCFQKNGELHPQIFVCPHGWFFVEGFCQPDLNKVYGIKDEIPKTEDKTKSKQEDDLIQVESKTVVAILGSDSHILRNNTSEKRNDPNFGPQIETTSIPNTAFGNGHEQSFENHDLYVPLFKDDDTNLDAYNHEQDFNPNETNDTNTYIELHNSGIQDSYKPSEPNTHFELPKYEPGLEAREDSQNSHNHIDFEDRRQTMKPEVNSHNHFSTNDELSHLDGRSVNKPRVIKMEPFVFSTEKSVSYPPDNFLADKFDLTNYETVDDTNTPTYDFANSFENGGDFW